MIEVKKSKFHTHLLPYAAYSQELANMKRLYPKANHFVYAYRYIAQFDQVVENQSDDGEPKGSSGKPSLQVLAGYGLINTAVITARIFGGTKLGVGGLVRAYGESVKTAIAGAELAVFRKCLKLQIVCTYSELSMIKRTLDNHDAVILGTEYEAQQARLKIEIPEDSIAGLQTQLSKHIDLQIHGLTPQ